jgi:hypothetical protein
MNKPTTLSEWKDFFIKWEQSGLTRKCQEANLITKISAFSFTNYSMFFSCSPPVCMSWKSLSR